MKARRGKVLAGVDRDRKAYALARGYLLVGFTSLGVTDEVLQHYINPRPLGREGRTMGEVFHRLLLSARNRNMMAAVIPDTFVDSLGPLLDDFTPAEVAQRFVSADHLLDTIIKELKPAGKVRRLRGGLWPLFTRATLSGARFLAQFASGPEFIEWVQTFDDDPRKRVALPMLLSEEIDGFGFALACDFLKELGFLNFAKPDVHVKAIVTGLGLSAASANDYAVFNAVARIAASCNTTPYDVDKLFWLVGSGRLYDHPSIGRQERIATNRDRFIRESKKALGPAA